MLTPFICKVNNGHVTLMKMSPCEVAKNEEFWPLKLNLDAFVFAASEYQVNSQ